jgi:glucose-6-phosphate dehydrogenase assembly protein OpcA
VSARADRAHARADWHGEDVRVGEVLTRLVELQARLSEHDIAAGAHPHPRSSVLNLVMVAPDAEAAGRAAEVAERLSAEHPLRSVVVSREAGDAPSRIDARVVSEAHELLAGTAVGHESVVLRVSGRAGKHLRSLFEPLLVGDVPSYLWWIGDVPFDDPAFREALEPCDVLVVDSSRFATPFRALPRLAGLAQELAGRLSVADLQWSRLSAWRELVAQFFAPGGRRPFLEGVNGMGVDYAGEGRGNRGGAALFAGWLMSNLGWRVKRGVGGAGGVVQAFLESPRQHPVELTFRSVPSPELVSGELQAVRLECVSGGRTCSLLVELDGGRRQRVRLEFALGGLEGLSQTLALGAADEPVLLTELVRRGRPDPVYLRALGAGAELLRSLS